MSVMKSYLPLPNWREGWLALRRDASRDTQDWDLVFEAKFQDGLQAVGVLEYERAYWRGDNIVRVPAHPPQAFIVSELSFRGHGDYWVDLKMRRLPPDGLLPSKENLTWDVTAMRAQLPAIMVRNEQSLGATTISVPWLDVANY